MARSTSSVPPTAEPVTARGRSRRALLLPSPSNVGLDRTPGAIVDVLNRNGIAVDVGVQQEFDIETIRKRYGVRLEDMRMVPAAVGRGVRNAAIERVLRPIRVRLAQRRLTRAYDLTIVQSRAIPLPPSSRRSALFCEFPLPNPTQRQRRRLRQFDRLLANSRFTANWIERFWGTSADVLYPSVHEPGVGTKKREILSVARFYQGGRPKGHWDLIEAFKRLVDRGTRDWELVLAGLSTLPEVHRRMEETAAGYPVRFLLDADIDRLSQAYRSASIFWHGAGIGIDPEAEPGRLEHFGITVAEAMCAGAVPLVHGAGGPVEIVDDPNACWATLDELVERTEELIRSPDQLARRSTVASRSAIARFGADAFARNVERLLLDGMN